MRMWLAWKRMDRAPRIVLLMLISIPLLSPVVYCGFSENWHDQQRMLQLLVLSGSSLLLLFSFPLTFSGKEAHAALLFILGLGSVSAFLSANPSWAFKEWSVFAGLMLFSFNISASPEWVRRTALWGLVVLGGFFCYQFLLSYLSAFVSGLRELNPGVLLSGFSNVRTMGQFQAMLLPLMAALGLYLRETGRFRLSWLVMLLLAIQWCISFALAGRGLWLGFAVAHLALCWIGPVGRRFLIVQLSAAFVGLALYFLLMVALPTWLGIDMTLMSGMRSGLSLRDVLWRDAWGMFVAHPLLGVGPMHFSAVPNSVGAHPHQMLLQWFAEWGGVAGLLVVGLMILGLLRGARYLREQGDPMDAGLWLALVSVLVLAQVDGVFVMPFTQTVLALLVGIAMARWSKPVVPSPAQRWLCRGLAVVVIVVLGRVLLLEVPGLTAAEERYLEVHGGGEAPRFWIQGWIPM
ncbi:O-antigen ligase family protein [Pseudomonas aeruginosa]|nr:O-antigen ligase family protein [Pseudomonas aeruginosa]MBG4156960.1 O-antigen ligase family protein [Pseudomonas aeruginosa]MBG4169193.1 O-antigen ligase family protein [Pseudomonas aeruginosa]MBG4488329.1 O-antigen ligase family protein [Pseudomonas aeruginosa]MBG4500554.1 O-antigen ligase family protein [Pseudomonas aeruginosa]